MITALDRVQHATNEALTGIVVRTISRFGETYEAVVAWDDWPDQTWAIGIDRIVKLED